MQEYGSNNKVNNEVIRSITFTGDNFQYTGTLYLTPSITKIIFEKEESIITNISIPEVVPNTGSDKESKPFKKPNSPKMVDIYLPDHGHFNKLSISGGIVVTFFNRYNHPIYISFNEVKVPSNTLFVDDRIHITNQHNSNYYYNKNKYKHNKKQYLLRDINIKGVEYKILKTTSYLKFNGNNKYPKRWELHCSTCDIIISNIDNYTSINNLISKANTYNNSICKSCNRLYSSTEEINKNELLKYKQCSIDLTCITTGKTFYHIIIPNHVYDTKKIITYKLIGSCNHEFSLNELIFNGTQITNSEVLNSLIKNDILEQLKNTKSCTKCKNNNFINVDNINIITKSIMNILQYQDPSYAYCGICEYPFDNNTNYGFLFSSNSGWNSIRKYIDTNCAKCGSIFVMPDKYFNKYNVQYSPVPTSAT